MREQTNPPFRYSQLRTLEWDILNPDQLINLEKKEENKHYLIWRLRKRLDQALIPISTIQKFPAQLSEYTYILDLLYRPLFLVIALPFRKL